MGAITLKPGFGNYTLPTQFSFPQLQTTQKTHKIASCILLSSLTLLAVSIKSIPIPIAIGGGIVFAVLTIKKVLELVGIINQTPPIQIPLAVKEKLVQRPYMASITQNGMESHKEKLNLIRAARHSIVISGCYGGGKALDETLDLIESKMNGNPKLTASLLFTNTFISDDNYKKFALLKKQFGERFDYLITPEVSPYLSPITENLTMTGNHVKGLVIDYGAAFIIGGSGILSGWSNYDGSQEPTDVEKRGFIVDTLKVKAFRDMDFVFFNPKLNGEGTHFYLELMKLFETLRYRYQGEQKPLPTTWPEEVDTDISMNHGVENAQIKLYPTGPDSTETPFLDELISQVSQAKKSIFISHMYFHPTPRLFNALIDATNRGVKITLLTNKSHNKSPLSHSLYSELSSFFAKSLYEAKEKPHIEIYEYNIPRTTLHKKVVVIDQKTSLIGSSNIGMKSLLGHDYEGDIKVESSPFAERVIQNLNLDKEFCHKVSSNEISWWIRVASSIQSFLFSHLL